jgi:hypothetical protein
LATSYLDEKSVFESYKKAVQYMDSYLEPVDEQERIARNQPHPGIDKAYPKTTDGTSSSIIKKTPRRIIQQLPTGRVISDTNDWLSIVAGFVYTNRIIPNANEQYALLQKCWLMTERAMTHGASHSYTPIVNRGHYIGPDMSVPYIKNVKFETGKLSDTDSNCEFLEAWYQPADIDAIIKKEKELKAKAKERGEQYESTWDLQALEEVKTLISQKTDKEGSNNSTKNRTDVGKDGVKLVHAFQRGVGTTFYTFHESSQMIVRRRKNKDPRGEIPMQTMYFETDGISPLGRGIIEQIGSLQNLLDSEMQMYQFNRALMLAPPLIKRGSFSKTQLKLVPNAIIDIGNDPNSSIDTLKIDTSAIANFATNYGLLKSQILNLASSPDSSISAEVGNPGFSKTPAGVNMQQANVSVDDNYVRKQFETWFERWSETAINLYFAERTGVEELQLDQETAMKLRKIDQTLVSPDDKIIIDYDTATEALRFEVDASTSNMKNDAQQLEALDGLLARLEKSPILAQTIPQEKVIGTWNAIVASSGVENPEELTVDLQEWEQEQEQMAMQEQQMQQQMLSVATQPVESMPPQEPQMMPEQQDMSEDDLAFITALQDLGYSDEKIQQALAMDQMGVPNEEIIQVLEMTK